MNEKSVWKYHYDSDSRVSVSLDAALGYMLENSTLTPIVAIKTLLKATSHSPVRIGKFDLFMKESNNASTQSSQQIRPAILFNRVRRKSDPNQNGYRLDRGES